MPRTNSQRYRHVNECDIYQEDDNYFVIEEVDCDLSDKEEIHTNLVLNGESVKIKIDSGAKCNVLTKTLASQISKAQKTPIKVNRSQQVMLIPYGGDSFWTLGTTTMVCSHAGETHNLLFHIVDRDVTSLLGLPDTLRLKLLQLSPEVFEVKTVSNTADVPEFTQYADLFDGKLGKLPVKYKMTVDNDVEPVVRAARKLPVAMKTRIKSELDSMEKQGVISPITEPTEWCSNMVCAKKKNKDEMRVCIDPKDLNKALKRPHHPLKTIEDILTEIPNARYFSVLDAKNSFWQIPLDTESSKLTCFATPFGRYIFKVLPYGVTVGSEVYQQTIEHLFADTPCDAVVDDLLIHGTDLEDHDRKLAQVLDRCREVNLKLNPSKCKFRVSRVSYVGHILSDQGVLPDPDKVAAITDMPQPTEIKGLQRFLGMVNYLNKFIDQHSALTKPLRELLQTDAEFKWKTHHTVAFEKIKKAIADIAALSYYDVTKPVTITCDSSKSGLGAALLQDGKPIHFASRALKNAETNYAQIQKELLAVVFCSYEISTVRLRQIRNSGNGPFTACHYYEATHSSSTSQPSKTIN